MYVHVSPTLLPVDVTPPLAGATGVEHVGGGGVVGGGVVGGGVVGGGVVGGGVVGGGVVATSIDK